MLEAEQHPTPIYDNAPETYISKDVTTDAPPPSAALPTGWEQHPLAVQALAEEDNILLQACKDTLAAVSPDIWEEDTAYNLIIQVAEAKRRQGAV